MVHTTDIYFFAIICRVDTFKVKSSKNLGKITKVLVGHDNKGFAAAWYLSKVSEYCTVIG